MAYLTSVSHPKPRIIENFVVVWLDPQVDEFKDDYEKSITQLRRIVNSIKTYNDIDECLQFLRTIKDERIFVIVSGGLGRQIIDSLQTMRTVVTVYIFCYDEETHKKWAINYTKIKKVFTDIDPLCKMLKEDVRQFNSDLVSFSVISPPTVITEDSLNELDQSFMYSQLLKEILLEMTYDNNSKDELVKFCRIQYEKNPDELDIIKEFAKYYPKKTKYVIIVKNFISIKFFFFVVPINHRLSGGILVIHLFTQCLIEHYELKILKSSLKWDFSYEIYMNILKNSIQISIKNNL
jgi:hypothetical protein